MTTNARVGIDIEVLGYAEAQKRMAELERMLKSLDGRKARVQMESRLKELEKNKRALEASKIKLQADSTQVQSEISKIKRQLNLLGKMKIKNPVADGRSIAGLKKTNTQARRLKQTLTEINNLGNLKIKKQGIDSGIKQITQEMREGEAEARRYKNALKQVPSFSQLYNKNVSKIAHAGQAMQSMGNALTRMASPIRNMFRYMGIGAGFAAFNKVSEGLMSGFKRYDTMKNYEKSLTALGLDATQKFVVGTGKAQTAIENLNDAVLGLPTGLDEIVSAQKVYAGATGEMVKSTKTAIAANNTFLASAMPAKDQLFMQRYLASLASGAELTTMQWQSIGRIAPLALKAVAEELGVTTQELRTGKVAGQEFLDAFIKVGTEGKIYAAANVMKTTFEGLSANIENAFARMGEGMLKSLDSVFEAYNGRNLIQNLLGVDAKGNKVAKGFKDYIDGISESMQNWVKANPQKITDFINSLKSINWASLGKGFAKGIGSIAKSIQLIAKAFGGKNLSLLGKGMAYLMPLGSTLTVMGGLWKGGRHIWGLFPAMGIYLGRGMKGFGKAFGVATAMKLGSKIKKFGDFLKGFGKVEKVAKTAAGQAVSFKAHMSTIGKMLTSVAAVAAVPVIIGGAGFLFAKEIKSIIKDIREISDVLKDFDAPDVANLKKLGVITAWVTGITTFAGAIAAAASKTKIGLAAETALLGGIAYVGAVVNLIGLIGDLFTGSVMRSVKNLSNATKYMNDVGENLKGLKRENFNLSNLTYAAGQMAQIVPTLKVKGLPSTSEAAEYKNLYGNLADTVKSIADAGKQLGKISKIKFNIDDAKETGKKIGTGLAEIYRSIEEEVPFILKEGEGSGLGKTITENMTSMLTSITGAIDNFKVLAENSAIKMGDAKVAVDKIVGDRKSGTGLVGLYDQLLGAFSTEKQTAKQKGPDAAGTTWEKEMSVLQSDVDNTVAMASIIENMGKSIGGLREAYDVLTSADTGLADIDTGVFRKMTITAGNMIDSISVMWADIKGGIKNFSDAESMTQNFTGLLSVVRGVKPIITELSQMASELGGMGGQERPDFTQPLSGLPQLDSQAKGRLQLGAMFDMLPKLTDSLTQMAEGIQNIPDIGNLSANVGQLKTAVSGIKEMMEQLSSLGESGVAAPGGAASAVVGHIRSLISQLGSALSTEAITGIRAKVEAFKQAINDMFEALNTDFSNVEVEVHINGKVTGDKETVAKLRKAHNSIKRERDKIKRLSQSISLSFPISVSLPGLESAISKMYSAAARLRSARRAVNAAKAGGGGGGGWSTGGMVTPYGAIYRSKGGSIHAGFPGAPRGTDTVPMWGTPGEYVTKKSAVDFWGIDFMRKVNHMDVAGVMRSLSAKAGSVMSTARSTIINNNTTNNYNMNNTQHINTNNPNFAFRRTRAFGAL